MATYFRNPWTGVVVEATNSLTWLSLLLWSPLHFLYKSIWPHAIISLILGPATLFISNIVYAFVGYDLIKNYYRKLGWQEIPHELVAKAQSEFAKRSVLREIDLGNLRR